MEENRRERTELKEKQRLTTEEIHRLPKDATFSLLRVASRLVRKKDKNDNPFWDISVMDGTGQIDGKIWSSSKWWNLEGDSRIRLDPLANDAVLDLC